MEGTSLEVPFLYAGAIQIAVYRAVIKTLSFRASAHTGVGIPYKFAECRLKLMGIATLVLQSAADLLMIMVACGNHTTILCGLVRNDMVIWQPVASIRQSDKLQFEFLIFSLVYFSCHP